MGLLSVDLSARDELKRSLPTAQRTGIEFPRYFTAKLEDGKTPYDEVSGNCAPPPSATIKAR